MTDLEGDIFAFLTRKYVQRSDTRQIAKGLMYITAETHDLVKELAKFFEERIEAKNDPFKREREAQEVRDEDQIFTIEERLALLQLNLHSAKYLRLAAWELENLPNSGVDPDAIATRGVSRALFALARAKDGLCEREEQEK